VFYYLENDMDGIRICDEQTVYIIIEDCIQTVTDELTVAPGDTIYFNALANDYIEPRFEYPVDTLNCQNQLPQIHPASFSLLTQGAELTSLGNGQLCFSNCALVLLQVAVFLTNIKCAVRWVYVQQIQS